MLKMSGRAQRRPVLTRNRKQEANLRSIHQIWSILSRRERIEGGVLLFCMALGGFFEAVSIGLILPFVAALKSPELIPEFPLFRRLSSLVHLNNSEPSHLLIALGVALVGAFLLKSGYLIILFRAEFAYVFAVYQRLSRQLLAAFLNAPYTFHLQRNSAELIKVTTETVHRFASGFLFSLIVTLGELVVMLAFFLLLLFINPLVTIGAMIMLGLPTAIIYWAMRGRLRLSGRTADQSFGAVLQWIEQSINGTKEIIVAGCASFFLNQHDYHLGRYARSMLNVTFLSAIPRTLIDTLTVSAFIAMVLMLLVRGQNLESILPLLTTFAIASIRLMPSASRIANGMAQLRFHYAAIEVIDRELQAARNYGFERQSLHRFEAAAVLSYRRVLTLEHVSFTFPAMPLPTLDDVSFEIPKGSWVALIGPTGAGKTTLLDLILGLFVPTAGRILNDGRDLQEKVHAWQRKLGLVPQSVYLMDDTIRRNVAFGVSDDAIDESRVWQALQSAHVDRLVQNLPGGLDAMIGQRGERLSGGERQRLGIARALYHDPEVLVIDEGTAHLDNETEAAIGRTLAELRGEKTIILIAHRMTLMRHCDHIFVLEQGRLRASGNYSHMYPSGKLQAVLPQPPE